MSDDQQHRRREVRKLTEKCGYAAAALTLIPLPFTEAVAVVPIHVGMVVSIGNVYGIDVTKDSANELLIRIGATVGLSLVGSHIASTAAKILMPGIGGLISAPFMFASTLAIGAVSRAYFENGGELSNADIQQVYKDELAEARKRFDPRKARSKDARQMAKTVADKKEAAVVPIVEKVAPTAVKDKAVEAAREQGPLHPEGTPLERLEELKGLLDKGLIDQAEYDEVKQRILSEL